MKRRTIGSKNVQRVTNVRTKDANCARRTQGITFVLYTPYLYLSYVASWDLGNEKEKKFLYLYPRTTKHVRPELKDLSSLGGRNQRVS